jgi:pseudaminic acid biosynthesis-associated methylase
LSHPGLTFVQPIQGFHTPMRFDVTMTRGLLIHIPPEDLPAAYEALYEHSKRWIIIAEYYSPTPREIDYRGEKGKLWARDFAGDMLSRWPGLKLVDYGFVSRRDANPQDDINWWLLEK